MIQENKELLLKDICSRLPFNHLVEYKGEEYNVLGIAHGRLVLCKPFMSYTLNEHPLVEEVKLYLFPMSSMTKEQMHDFYCRFVENEISFDDFVTYYWKTNSFHKVLTSIDNCERVIDWFNENHFDYRGLIEKGLAIDAAGLNIY